jgi:phosphoglycolate phosphatase
MKYKAIFFDLDGTLSDPREGIINSIQYATDFYGIKTERSDLYKYIGPPLLDTFAELIGEEKAGEALLKYRERFDSGGGIFENELYPGVKETLEKLDSMGYILCTASSKPQVYVSRILDYFGMKNFFSHIGGASFDESISTKSRVIKKVIDDIGISTEDVLMVGDRKYDLEAASKLGMDAVGALYGFGDYAELSSLPSIALINKIEDLPAVLKARENKYDK